MNNKILKDGIDLHIHTTKSHGMRTVEETIKDAEDENLRAIAITDHNTFAIKEPRKVNDLEVIPGAEFSTLYKNKSGKVIEIHIVGIFFNGINDKISGIFDNLHTQREKYIKAIMSKLQELGVNITYEDLITHYKDSDQIGRPQIAHLILERGYASSIDEAFDKYIGNYSPYFIDPLDFIHYMDMDKCVKLISENGGIPILAHPYHYNFTYEEIEDLIRDFKKASENKVAAMEVYYIKYDENKRNTLKTLTQKYGLLSSAGSDRHKKTDSFTHEPYTLIEEMKNALNKTAIEASTESIHKNRKCNQTMEPDEIPEDI